MIFVLPWSGARGLLVIPSSAVLSLCTPASLATILKEDVPIKDVLKFPPQQITPPLALETAGSSFTGIDFVPNSFANGPVLVDRIYTATSLLRSSETTLKTSSSNLQDLFRSGLVWSARCRGPLVEEVKSQMKAIRLGLLISLIVTMGAACASTDATPPRSMTTTTLMAGWEHHFTVEWAAAEQNPNARKVSGYVYNQNGEFATSLRVLAQALDPTGAVVGQRVAYVPGGVGGFGRAYFEVLNLPVAETYLVSVWDYTWFQAPKNP
jgi:hypothetical protein